MPLSVIFPGIWPGIWPVTSDPWPILQESVLLIGHQLPLYFWTAIFACHQREWSFQWLIGISNVNSTIFFLLIGISNVNFTIFLLIGIFYNQFHDFFFLIFQGWENQLHLHHRKFSLTPALTVALALMEAVPWLNIRQTLCISQALKDPLVSRTHLTRILHLDILAKILTRIDILPFLIISKFSKVFACWYE